MSNQVYEVGEKRKSENPIRAGAALSLGGSFSTQGRQAFQGLSLWAQDVNQAGGIRLGRAEATRPLYLRVYDDRSRKGEVVDGVERLITADEVDLLFGPYGSSLALATAPVAERHQMVFWNHGGATNELHYQGNEWVVSLLTPAIRYYASTLDIIRALDPEVKRIFLVHRQHGSFSKTVADGAQAHAENNGFEVVQRDVYPDAGEMQTIIDAIRRSQPEVILGVGTVEQDIEFARVLIEAQVQVKAVGLVAVGIQKFHQVLGREADGFLAPSQWEPGAQYRPQAGPDSETFVRRYRQAFGERPDYPAAQAYAAGVVAQRCAEIAGSLDNRRLRQLAGDMMLETFYGGFNINPKNGAQVLHSMLVVQWQAEDKHIVWPADAAQHSPRYPWRAE